MPTYTIRTDNGDGPDGAGETLEFAHRKAACDDAQLALAEMVKETMPVERRAHFGVEIDDEAGRRVYRATLDFEGRHDPDAEPCPDVASQLGLGPRE